MEENNFKLYKFSEIDPSKIVAFNAEMYHKAIPESIEDIRWRFRIGFDTQVEPLYLVANDEIVGQAGLSPTIILKNNQEQIAIWFNNFIVSSTLQGKGLGKILTKAWMALAPVHITNCNDNSMAVFRKLGWQDEFSTTRFALPLNVHAAAKSKNWTGFKLALTQLLNPLYNFSIRLQYLQAKKITAIPLSNLNPEKLLALFPQDKSNCLLKDAAWFNWRFFDGPLSKEYSLLQLDDASMIIRIFQLDFVKRLHVVLQTPQASSNKNLLKGLIRFSLEQKIDLIWSITNIEPLKILYSSILKHKIQTRFAFQSDDAHFMNEIKNQPIPLQAADSDYDIMYA